MGNIVQREAITDFDATGMRALHTASSVADLVTSPHLSELRHHYITSDGDCGAVWGEPRSANCPKHAIVWVTPDQEAEMAKILVDAGIPVCATDGYDWSENQKVYLSGAFDLRCPSGAH